MAGCAPLEPDPLGDQLRAQGNRLVDDRGREVLLRGINARIQGLFDVSFDDGRIPLEEIPAFGRKDFRFLKEEMGFNALRIPINWSGLQPNPGPLHRPYLQRLDGLLDQCADFKMWCLVDLHQDAYSKEIGEDGAPLWAIKPAPTQLLEGPLEDLEARRTSAQVLAAFETFFGNQEGVQDAFIEMLEDLTRHLRGKPYVAGIEIFNEPVGDNLEILQFSARAIRAIHEVDPERLAVFEPNALRNLFDRTEVTEGMELENDAYAPHLYPEVFSGQGNNFQNGDTTRLIESTARARLEADAHDAPLMVTEYGLDPMAENAALWIDTMENEMDRARASRFFWVYEELAQDKWGLFDEGRMLRENLADQLSRPFPGRVEGFLENYSLDKDVLRIEFSGKGKHEIHVGSRWSKTPQATCDGDPIPIEGEEDSSHS
jgi:endoglycosylceramidase